MPTILLTAVYLIMAAAGARAAEPPSYDYRTFFDEDAFAQYHTYEDFARRYASPDSAYPPYHGCPPYYDFHGYHYRFRYYRIGTLHHYAHEAAYTCPPAKRIYRKQPEISRFPFFPHRPYSRPGQFWWDTERRHRRFFYRVVRPVEHPARHYRDFFLLPH
jgi:hypothetical protein